MRRDWTAARLKIGSEPWCRACVRAHAVDAAHIIPRSRISIGGEDERNIIPLCRACHAAYDQGTLDILPVLTREEQAYAAELVGLAEAYRRTTNARLAA
jgi:5-methylcytosine-specific restriction endonuclease McrA